VLHPVQLSVGGLVSALEELAQSLNRLTKVKCTFEWDDGVSVGDEVAATNLYRIAQEAANNAIKHAEASTILIELRRRGDWIRLSVSDDGIGFSPPAQNGHGMGLPIMNSRASLIGATFDVHPLERGTMITCSLRMPQS